jgi:hypothetical protein
MSLELIGIIIGAVGTIFTYLTYKNDRDRHENSEKLIATKVISLQDFIQEQTKDITKEVWVFSETPLEMVRKNKAKGVKYVYFVPEGTRNLEGDIIFVPVVNNKYGVIHFFDDGTYDAYYNEAKPARDDEFIKLEDIEKQKFYTSLKAIKDKSKI